MTSDPPKSSTSPKSPRSPPSRSASMNSQYARAYQYHPMTGSSASSSKSPPKPAGPRPPDTSRTPKNEHADRPGSSYTIYLPDRPKPSTSPKGTAEITATPESAPTPPKIDETVDAPHAPYRPPEAVIEPPEEHPPGFTPGIIAEHTGSDDDMLPAHSATFAGRSSQSTLAEKPNINVDAWQANLEQYNMMDVDESTPSPIRPIVGEGVLPRRLLMLAHEHELVQPHIHELPQPPAKKSHNPTGSTGSATLPVPSGASRGVPSPVYPSTPSPSLSNRSSASIRSIPDSQRIATLDDVWDALPGSRQHHNDWYFCIQCWGWIRITTGRGSLPDIAGMEEWEQIARLEGYKIPDELETVRTERGQELSRLNDVLASRTMAEESHHHFHEFRRLIEPTPTSRIERVIVDESMNVFPHLTFGLDSQESWTKFDVPQTPARLFVSCSSDLWAVVDAGLVPGQLPAGLVKGFTAEKLSNPGPGMSGVQSVNEAWSLITTLLMNPLFKGQRGWVKLDNPKFQNKIGAGLTSSHILYQIGFACRQEEQGLRVGPFMLSEDATDEEREQADRMDQYMLRAWVETTLYLIWFSKRNDVKLVNPPFIDPRTPEEMLKEALEFQRYPRAPGGYSDSMRPYCHSLGVTQLDKPATTELGYGLQISCDPKNTPKYLGALEKISDAPIIGKDMLQIRVATERSLDKYTLDDVENAYKLVGYTPDYAETISVPPQEAPDEYILKLHKEQMGTASIDEKQRISQALVILGKERNSKVMKELGSSGRAMMSIDEAYSALSAPRDAVDDGLIMQYEMAVNEYPGKADHYRSCLSIIANDPEYERPGLKTFLETGSREPEAPPSKDIPVGLQNIGNTCYLNSILQYLYSIKPLRDAVLSFEQDAAKSATPNKPEVERSKRFVRQLRVLFLQLYKSEQPSVRPDEELAYLAITRPEVDAIVEPEVSVLPPRNTLDSIPDIPNMPSPSSTRVASPETSPQPPPADLPSSSSRASPVSVLGKRASEDRDDSSRSSGEHARVKSEGFSDAPMEVDEFELVQKPTTDTISISPPEYADSPSAATGLEQLALKSPIEEKDEPKFDPPSVPPPLPARPAIAKRDTLVSGLRFGLQQDSAEVLINVLSQLELALDQPSEKEGAIGSNLIQSLFSCKYRQQIIYSASPASPSKQPQLEAQTPVESVFVHPIIGVEEEGKDLYDCLGELYLGGSEIEYEGKKGVMMDLMDEFPPMLYIQMRRSQYDPATGRERKTNTHIGFGQTLSMDRFLVGADARKREEAIEITREMMRVRSRLHQLQSHKPLSIPETFKHAASALRQLSTSEVPSLEATLTTDLFEALDAESEVVTREIAQLQESLPQLKSRIDALWAGEKREYEYELVAVYMHRGKTSGAGHYWTYQSWLPGHPETFFKYNDETVTKVDSSEVLQDRTGSDANPALLCYVRKGSITASGVSVSGTGSGSGLIDTLHREVLEIEREQESDRIKAE